MLENNTLFLILQQKTQEKINAVQTL